MSRIDKLQLIVAATFFICVACLVPVNLKNDLDGNLFHLLFIKSNIASGTWSNWNSNLHQGLPVMGDPINAFWHPLAALILVFPVEVSVRLIFGLSWVMAAVFAYFLFRRVSFAPNLSLWMGVTYASGGYFLARIIAGHFEKVLLIHLFRFFFLAIVHLWRKQNVKNILHIALALFLFLASTDMYNFFYICIGYMAFGLFILVTNRKIFPSVLVSILLGVGISAIRWVPMLEVLKEIFKIPDPYSGSQNLLSLVIQTIWPKPSMFSWIVPTNFGWWEKVGFIGPVFIIGLTAPWWWRKVKSKSGLAIAAIFAVISILIAMPAFSINPWHWAVANIEQLSMFHVPTRVLAIFSLSLMIASGYILNRWKVWGIRFVKLNLILIAVYWLTMFNFKMLPKINPAYDQLKRHVPDGVTSIMYPAFDNPVLERDWHRSWQLFHTTHGTYIKNSPSADWTSHIVNGVEYINYTPEVLVWPDDMELPFSAEAIASESGITIYKTNTNQDIPSSVNLFSDKSYYIGAAISLGLLSFWVWLSKRK